MDRKLNIGIVGLGNIAQKVYIPFLSKEKNWSLAGAYSPTESRRKQICGEYRIKDFSSLHDLINNCDAVFVHSSTDSHYDIIFEALNMGKDVYVDKPLTSTIEQSEQLVKLSIKKGRKLMVGFNRRFAPMYLEAKNQINNVAWIRVEKHRIKSSTPADFKFTMLDDYIHLVDTARWLGEPAGSIEGHVEINEKNQMIYAEHNYISGNKNRIFIGMHRSAGTNLEQLEIVGENAIVRVKNMDTMEAEREGKVITNCSPSWETIIKRRGFEDAIMHFINSVIGDTEPSINGEEALKSQILVGKMIEKTGIVK
ncbi:MAG: virulence factor MviM [Clostridiaceae bacterium]|nr:virulence factor MviM [Clostridiaceae bacterium]